MRFSCFGHPNILGNHRNTFEFTKDSELTLNGDCIIGVRADFSLDGIFHFISKKVKEGDLSVVLRVIVGDDTFVVNGTLNSNFLSSDEIVVRITNFLSDRTLIINADKAAKDFSRAFISKLKSPKQEIIVELV